MSRGNDGWIDFGECKWRPVRSLPGLARELEDELARYPHAPGATMGRWFFARKLPARRALPAAPNAHWVDLDDLYRA